MELQQMELQQEARELILNHIQQKKISQSELEEMLRAPSGTITNIINEAWEGVAQSTLLRIKSFFRVKKWNIIETYNLVSVQTACSEARLSNQMRGIIGYSGAGKTTALLHYYKTNPNTYLVTCGRAMRTKQFLSEILKSLGVNYLASDFEMVRVIIEELNAKESPLLIIDEASKLSPNALMYLQDIWDGIEDNGGIVLSGVEYLLSNIKKGAEKNKIGMPEFYGRVSKWTHLQPPVKKEIEAISLDNGVTDSEFIKSIYRLGNFRFIRNVIKHHLNTV